MGDRYQLKNKCMFVDAFKRDGNNPGRKPDAIPHPHVFDQNHVPPQFKIFNDDYGFVARFIVQGVDTDLIAEIVQSEYGNQVPDPKDLVQKVVTEMAPFLEPRAMLREFDAKPSFTCDGPNPYKNPKFYDLDFSPNWFGTGCCKF